MDQKRHRSKSAIVPKAPSFQKPHSSSHYRLILKRQAAQAHSSSRRRIPEAAGALFKPQAQQAHS